MDWNVTVVYNKTCCRVINSTAHDELRIIHVVNLRLHVVKFSHLVRSFIPNYGCPIVTISTGLCSINCVRTKEKPLSKYEKTLKYKQRRA